MDYSVYICEQLTHQRLRELREAAAAARRLHAARARRRPLRDIVGAALVALGERLRDRAAVTTEPVKLG